MPEKQPTNSELTKVSARSNIISTFIASIVTLLVAIVGVVLGPIFLHQWASTPTPTIEPTHLSRDWYVIFELRFPANYWAEGVHSFLFDADCPFGMSSTSENGPTNAFSVDRTAEIQDSTVFIRRRGLYLTEIKGDAFGHFIHPSQETAAIYTLFALSFEDAKRLRDECKVAIKIDDGSFVDLAPTELDKIQ
jgi:hypothetical protein